MEFIFGYTNPTVVEVTNKKDRVEYSFKSGITTDERAVRAAVGNVWKGTYSYHFEGFYSDRNLVIERIQQDIKETKDKLEELEFALKVTKKRRWVRV